MKNETIAVNSVSVNEEKPDVIMKINNTTYDIFIHFSETSKETMTDKILRLIENEADF